MGKIKKLKSNELIGGVDREDVYPITSTKAVFDNSNTSQDDINKNRLERIEDLEETMPTTVKSITINGGTKTYLPEDGNVELTIYSPGGEDYPGIAEAVQTNTDNITAIQNEIGIDTTEDTLSGRIKILENAVGTGGSVDQRIENAINDLDSQIVVNYGDANPHIRGAIQLADGKLTRFELEENNIASASDLQALDEYTHSIYQTKIEAVSTRPATGLTGIIYRVPNSGGTTYTDWMYNDGWKELATFNIATLNASDINYDNSISGLAPENVQEAIDEVVETTAINSVIDIASQYEIQFYLYNNKWHETDQNQVSKHICVAPGQRYRITANSSYGVSLYYLHKFAPAANVSATYTQVRLDAGTTTIITIPSDMYHLVFLDNTLQSGGLFKIPDSVELVDDTSSIVVKHSDEIGVLENAALNEVVLGVYGNPDCTKTKKNLKIDGSLLNTTLEGFNVSNFIAIPSGTDYIEYKNVSANYHDELCGLLVADASNNVLWYNSVSNGILDLSDYNDAAYIRFMPLYNTSYASIRFIKREPMQGEYIGLELGGFEFSGELTTHNTRARAIIANPHNILKIKDGYGMFVFAGNENAYPTTLELIANGVSWFDSDTTDYPYLWLMVRDASGTDISLEERDLTEIVSIGGNVPQEVVRGREEIDKFVKLRSCIVDANGGGQFTTISDAVANMPDGSTILIMPGRYEESVHMWGRNLHLVGIDKESCILVNGTGNYSTPPLEANIGSISNMTIIADNYSPTIEDPTINHNSPDYCIHIEQANDSAYQFRVSNCIMNAKWNSAIGLGLRYNQTVIVEDCDIRTECVTCWSGSSNMWIEQGAIFFHNDAVATNNETGHLRVSNCRLRGLKPALSVFNVANHPYAEVEFDNNTLISDTYGVGEGIIYRRGQTPSQGYWAGDRITLSIASHGNNISEMNA